MSSIINVEDCICTPRFLYTPRKVGVCTLNAIYKQYICSLFFFFLGDNGVRIDYFWYANDKSYKIKFITNKQKLPNKLINNKSSNRSLN